VVFVERKELTDTVEFRKNDEELAGKKRPSLSIDSTQSLDYDPRGQSSTSPQGNTSRALLAGNVLRFPRVTPRGIVALFGNADLASGPLYAASAYSRGRRERSSSAMRRANSQPTRSSRLSETLPHRRGVLSG